MKIQSRFLLLIFGFFITIIVIYSVVIYLSVSEYSYVDFYKRLEIRAITTAKINVDSNSQNTDALRDLRRKYLERLDNERHFIFRSDSLDLGKQADKIGVSKSFLKKIIQQKSANYNREKVFMTGILYGNHIVIVSATNYYNTNQINYLRGVMISSIVFVLIFVFLFSLLFSRRIFLPISRITKSVNTISTENLNHRLDTDNREDELGELSRTFNNMLDRLETSFETQNNFISNASHELRTPLTSIMGVADVMLSKPRTQEEYIDALKVITEEAEKLDKKTKALLFLAQTGFNGKIQAFIKLRIDQLVIDAISTTKKIYPDCPIDLDLEMLPENSEMLAVSGNEQLLHLAISNIIGNACKYSDNKEVKISIGATHSHIVLVIKDSGVGIPAGEIAYIYDPFFRASNTRSFEGYGIGLPLSRNIIKIHKGELLVTAIENQGTTVQVKLPIRY